MRNGLFLAILLLVGTLACLGHGVQAKEVEQLDAAVFRLSFENDASKATAIGDVQLGVESAFSPLGKAVRLHPGGHLRMQDLGQRDAFSIELWIKLYKQPSEGIAAIYAADQWKPGFVHFNLKRNGSLEFAINGVRPFSNTDPETLVVGKWTHIVASYDRHAAIERVFVDGRLVMETPVQGAGPVRLVPGSIGVWMNGQVTRPLAAAIDEFAVYAKSLSPGEVRTRYLTGKGVELTPVDFATQIRPLLQKNCFDCHGPDTAESGLRLDIRDSTFRGGDSGEPAVLPHDADASELIRLVSGADVNRVMPPDRGRLSDSEVALLRTWIDQGAHWPDSLAGRLEQEKVQTDHWSFQPIRQPVPPKDDHPFVATGHAIDAFVFSALKTRGLMPSAAADRRTLIRRLYLDVHGLPPTVEQIDQFLADDTADAWSKLVERVLESPRYGERWASHWLDVIRYGDTHGFEVNTPRANAWPYRDYVIKSLNEDKPYDQFLREQLTGDQLGVDAATGFLVAAPALLPGQIGKDEPSMRQARSDELHEVIQSVGAGVLGLTLGCARCHNHKFDPLSQKDYYRFQAIFAGLRYGERPLGDPETVALGPSCAAADQMVFAGIFAQAGPTHRLYRGDPMQRRERMAPDVPAVLGTLQMESTADESARRLALADWLASPDNPLTARVIVNRIWQHHFGNGLVATPSDFGAMGVAPTHPELLDWLASTLIQKGWSLKAIHRLILNSNTYRQSSFPRAEGLTVDRDTHFLWRFPPRRLDMEPIRDSILAVSGALDLTMGGPGFSVFKPNDNYVRVYEPKDEWGPDTWRRMIYMHRVRMEQPGVFGPFDCPDAGQPAPRRTRSTTAIQALSLFNSTFVIQQSQMFAQRLQKEVAGGVDKQIEQAFLLAYGRLPTQAESEACIEVADEHGMAAVCRAIFNSNEFPFLP